MDIVTVAFKSDIVELVDGCVSVKKICDNLGVDHRAQFTKIQSDPSYGGRIIGVEINGITQGVLCIPVEKLNGWLFSINTAKVKDSIREKLIAYKNECFNALNDYFNKGAAIKPEVKAELENIILRQNEQIAQLTRELGSKPKRLPPQPTDENLKRVLIRVHDGYHRILTTCSPLDMIDELRRMTNLFQCIGSIKKNGNNLNTDTVAGHIYWYR